MSMFILSTQEDGINRVCFKSCINSHIHSGCVRVMVFNNTSAISWQSVLLVEETGGSGENHRPVASHRQTLLHNVVLSIPHRLPYDTTLDCRDSCKSNYHTITMAS